MALKESIVYQSKLKIFFIGLIAAVAIYYSSGMQPANNPKIRQLKNDISAAQEKLKQTIEKTNNKAKFQEEVEQVSQTVRLALDYLPKEIEIQNLLKKVYSEARSAGVQLSQFKPKEVIAKDFYDEVPMEIELKGSYSQIVMFLSYVSKIPRIINIRNVEITDPKFFDGIPQMKFKGVLVAYRYKEST
ncbi:MAG: type 4a pilus biogenesis protein PilO [Oligoflexia bacterium]|nr:type 4a pilus biogenesis protein PilO [Oligoflexia bacterium]